MVGQELEATDMEMNLQDMSKVFDIIKAYEGKIDKSFKIPISEYEARYAKILEKLDERKIDLGFFFWYREMSACFQRSSLVCPSPPPFAKNKRANQLIPKRKQLIGSKALCYLICYW